MPITYILQIAALDRPVVIRNYIPAGWQPLQWTVESVQALLPDVIDAKCTTRNRVSHIYAASADLRQGVARRCSRTSTGRR